MGIQELYDTARAIVADHKGILAADESTGTIKKRFDSIGIESTEESRRFYRQLLFTASGMEDCIGGVILYDETIRQAADDGTPFSEVLAAKGVIPGIKVDTGAHDQAGFPGEKVTEGLDGLRARLEEYRELGARFAKWRAVITIGEEIPSTACIRANAHALARYAALCQEAGIVPIVEPEVLMDADNTIERCLRGHRSHAALGVPRAPRPARRPPGVALEAEHGDRREGVPGAGSCGAHRRAHRRLLPHARSCRGTGHRLPLRRTVGGRGDGEPECDQPGRRALAALVLLRARAPGVRARGVGRGGCERRSGADGLRPPGAHERARSGRGVVRRAGAADHGVDGPTRPVADELDPLEEHLLGALEALAPPPAPVPVPQEAEAIWRAQLDSRQADYAARWLQQHGRSFYTIGSSGHESNAAVALGLRVDDPALLHYRSGAFYLARASQGGIDGLRDILLGVVAAAAEPIAGGRHKVFGRYELAVLPMTSTIASHLPRAVGMALAIDRGSTARDFGAMG